MKKVLLVAVLVTAAVVSQAQVRFGAKAGINIATLGGDDLDDAEGKKSNTGFYFGGLVNIPLSSNFAFQPELIYSAKQGLEFDDDGDEVNLNLNYINIPLMLQYMSNGFVVEAGPQIGFNISSKYKTMGIEVDFDDAIKGIDFGANFGLGYITNSGFGFNARYNLGLSNIAEEDGDIKNRVFQVGVVYMFGAKAGKTGKAK
jgi:hypothetical protein